MRRILLAVLVCLLMAAPALAEDEDSSTSWMIFENLTEEIYTQVLSEATLPVYTGETLAAPADLQVDLYQTVETTISVPEDGMYEIWFAYQNTTETTLATELTLEVDGEIPFYELRRIQLESRWVDDGTIPEDRYGNQIAPTPYAEDMVLTKGLCDSAGRTAEPFLFSLTAGEHTLTITCDEGGVYISEISLRAPVEVADYEAGDATGDNLIVIEGEEIAWRNKSSIRGGSEFNSRLNPYSSSVRMINHLDGDSFTEAGDSVTYAFTVAETGWYNLGFVYRQNVKADFPVFLDVRIDGAIPSTAAQKIPLDYQSKFKLCTAQADGSAETFYLTAGEHTLTLTINAEYLTPAYELISDLLSEINGLSLEVMRLTGGITTDKYRDYSLMDYIPGFDELLFQWADECDDMVAQMSQYSDVTSAGLFSSFAMCGDQLRRLGEEPEDLPRRLSELSTGTNSAARMLAQELEDMAANDLSIDQIYFYQTEAELPQKANIFQSVFSGIDRFVHSFSAQDYSADSGDDDHLQVWVGRSRQYVEIMQNMADSQFTAETGITVDLSIMPDANKLVLSNAAGTAPDAVCGLQYVVPSYLDIRGALYDLTQFDDFGEIASRFSPGLFVAYTLQDGIYALPETVNFWVLFYRKDIFTALNIPVPDSLDEVKEILPELQRRNMNFYFPTAGMTGLKVFPGTLPLILQAGGSIYGDTIGNTTLDSEKSLAGFRELTDLFTIYNVSVDVPSPGFYQQFRSGTLPIGIADLYTYNLLLNAAPELEGLWDIALYPGLTNEDGEVQRWTTGGAETMGIMSQTDRADDAWEFLKWWSSEEVQAEFGNTLIETFGSEYIWPTANIEAFAQLPLASAHKQVIIEQMEWMTEAPWILGTYMLERELSNAYISVVVDGTEARRALDTAVKRIDRETYRKLEEFGFYKNGETIEELITPSVDVVQSYIDAYEASLGEEEED
ncbi:MAG TPA: extracellular solute-binding protein [Candidatus Limiplasma sp.]|nr:extracellular solute-binding protein [Candidatus Limiplasma sp.]